MRSKLRLDFPLPEKYSLAASLPKQKRLKDTPRRDRYSYGYVGREGLGWQRRFSRQTLACILFCNNRRRDQGKDKYKNSLFHAFYPFLLWLSPPSPFLLGRLKRVGGDRAQDWSQLEKQGLSERRNPYRPQELLRCARTHQRWQLGNRIDISVQDVDYKQRASVTSEVQEARALEQERKEDCNGIMQHFWSPALWRRRKQFYWSFYDAMTHIYICRLPFEILTAGSECACSVVFVPSPWGGGLRDSYLDLVLSRHFQ